MHRLYTKDFQFCLDNLSRVLCDFSRKKIDIYFILALDDLIETMLTRNPDMSYSCGQCNYTATRKSHVKAHVEAKHVRTTGFACKQCGKLCNTRNALQIHKTRFHSVSNERLMSQ